MRPVGTHGKAELAAGQAGFAAQLQVSQVQLADQVAGHNHVADISVGAPGRHRAQRCLGVAHLEQLHTLDLLTQGLLQRITALDGHPLAGQIAGALHCLITAGKDQAAAGQVGFAERHKSFAFGGLGHRGKHIDLAAAQGFQRAIPVVHQHRLKAQAQTLTEQRQVVAAEAAMLTLLVQHIKRRPAAALNTHADHRVLSGPDALLFIQRQRRHRQCG